MLVVCSKYERVIKEEGGGSVNIGGWESEGAIWEQAASPPVIVGPAIRVEREGGGLKENDLQERRILL